MCPRGSERNFAKVPLPKTRIENPPKRTGMSKKILALTLAALAAALTLGCEGDRLSPISSSQAQTAQAQPTASAPARLPDFSALVEQYGPAVVNISTTARVHTQAQEFQIPGEPGDPFYEFFRRFQIPQPRIPQSSEAWHTGQYFLIGTGPSMKRWDM